AELHPSAVHANVDRRLLKQALLNLMINALQAIESKDASADDQPRSRELILRTLPGDGDRAFIRVIDTGPGMEKEVAEQIFTPYFTTKAGGSGLGLPTTRRLIEEHGGHISVISEPGTGTEFTIDLPVGV
ncbi:MAG: ATP-binding protein, partial [Planctomycetota bacterium]